MKKNTNSKNMKQVDEEIKVSFKKKFIVFVLILLLITLIISSIFLGAYIISFQNMAKDMTNNTFSDVLDTDGNVIASLGSGRITSTIEASSIPQDLKNAYVSIEDQRYYTHHGIDIKRTAGAIFTYVKDFGKSSFGGSSITQQLVKNLTGDDSKNVTRKVKEWVLALALEGCFSKDEILSTYLNTIYVGPNIYGVGNASLYYFNKPIEDLTLEECAFIAGINNSPNSYSPFSEKNNFEKINSRTKTVLGKMLELGYISEESYNSSILAVESGLNFEKGSLKSTGTNVYSYHTDALLNELIDQISNKKHISEDFATNYLYMSGLKIYSTQNSNIQTTLETEINTKKYLTYSINDKSIYAQSAMVIIDHSTGHVIASVGGIGEKTTSRPLNRATQMKRQTGSAIKPIAVLLPAISEEIVTNSTVFADTEVTFDDGTEEGYSPINYDGYRGSITLRQAVETSQNIPFVTLMEQVTPEKSIKYLKKMGISTLTEKDNSLALALGGLDYGMTPLEFAAAYSTIANDGMYIEPTFYTEVLKPSGKIFIKPKQEKRTVTSKSASYILKNLLTEPVKGSKGTATYCSISGIDVAAKTGTTNENYDRWLAGFTPYYTAVTWYGFDMSESINFDNKNPAGLIWSAVMKKIHKELDSRNFIVPNGITQSNICSISGKIATDKCPNSYKEVYLNGTLPNKCTQH